MIFADSETSRNLMRAFAGECQSHTRYLLAAKIAVQQQLHVLRQLFEFTAKQELIHAQQFAQALSAQGITELDIAARYPLDPQDDLCAILTAAQAHEEHEAQEVYAQFAQTAADEGFQKEAALLRGIAEIEQTHANRFGLFAQLMRDGKLFREDGQTYWLCTNCGHVHFGTEPPQNCPVCNALQGFAVRQSLAPFTA